MPCSDDGQSSTTSDPVPDPYEPARSDQKRKRSTESTPLDDSTPASGSRNSIPKQTTHNMINERYSTRLNQLRFIVPSLRVPAEDCSEDLRDGWPAHELDEATILAKAIEYIADLEQSIKSLNKTNDTLRSRVGAFQILISMKLDLENLTAAQKDAGRYPFSLQ